MHEEPSLLNADGSRPCPDVERLKVVPRYRHERGGALEDEVVDVADVQCSLCDEFCQIGLAASGDPSL